MTERWDTLTRVRWPSVGLADLPVLLYWAAGIAIAAGVAVAAVGRLRLDGAPPVRAPQAAPGSKFAGE
jgi:hypothetical protein